MLQGKKGQITSKQDTIYIPAAIAVGGVEVTSLGVGASTEHCWFLRGRQGWEGEVRVELC